MHSSGESLCCLVVVHDRFVNGCIAMFYSGVTGIDMVQEALCFPDIPLPRFIPLGLNICNCLVNVVWITISEVMPAHNWLTRLITC